MANIVKPNRAVCRRELPDLYFYLASFVSSLLRMTNELQNETENNVFQLKDNTGTDLYCWIVAHLQPLTYVYL